MFHILVGSVNLIFYSRSHLQLSPAMSGKRPHRRSGYQAQIQCRICSKPMNEQSYGDHLLVFNPGEQSNLRPLGQSSLYSVFGRPGRRPETPNPTGAAADRSCSPVQHRFEEQQSVQSHSSLSSGSVDPLIATGISLSPHDDSQSPNDD